MAMPSDWDPARITAACPIIAWEGSAWRMHHQRYAPTDHGGSLRFSGRYHRGADLFPPERTWPALYLALGPEVALGEAVRHVGSIERLQRLNQFLLSEFHAELEAILDLRQEADRLGHGVICRDLDYEPTQSIAEAALARGAEGILVSSCTRLGDNLIVFPSRLSAASRIGVVRSRSLHLYVQR